MGKGIINTLRIMKSHRKNIKKGKIGLYYKGAFESPMTKREAYLILGVTQSTTAREIKDKHRKLMLLNHPDSG